MPVKNNNSTEVRKKFELLYNTLRDGCATVDKNGLVIECNQRFLDMLGYTFDELKKLSYGDITPPKWHELEGKILVEEVNKKGYSELYEKEYIHKNGSIFPVELQTYLIRDDDGVFLGYWAFVRDISDRKKIEEELKFRNLLLGTQQESSIDGILVVGKENQILSYNQRFVELWGIPPEILATKSDELALKSVLDKLVEPNLFLEKVTYLYEHQTEISFDEINLNDVRIFERYSAPMIDAEKNYHGRVWYFRDISKRRQLEIKLQKESAMLKSFIELNPYSMQVLDKNGFTIKVNKAHTKLFGAVPPPDYTLLNDPVLQRLGLQEEVLRIKKGEIVTFPEFYYNVHELNPNFENKPVWIRMVGFPIFDQEGKVENIGLMHEDITERKLAVEELSAEKERLSVTLRSIGDGVITTDTSGKVIIINKIAEEFTGWNQRDAEGKHLTEVFNIINEISNQSCENPVEKVLTSGKIVELANHTVLISRNGEKRIIADSAAPIKEKNGEIIGVVLVFRDMTEKYKLLEASITNQKLEALGVLAGGIAHDFNNLLGGIFGYIDLAYLINKDQKVFDYLEQTRATIDRARGLTQQLLTFSKGGAPVKTTAHLFPFIQETVLFALSGSNISYHFDIEENLPPCSFDKNQIGQVIDNIVINAKQAMPLGGEIAINACAIAIYPNHHPILPEGNYVKISIKDNGIGMPKEIITRIFDPFFTTKTTGHGLGLATCYSIISRHNGAIDVESEPGKGTTFYIYIPVSEEAAKLLNGKQSEIIPGSGTVIVMDDEAVIRNMIGSMLEILGYTPILKHDGKSVLDYFYEEQNKGKEIKCIIADITIPGGMGGKEIVAEIRKVDKEIPIIVSSGYAEDPVMANPLAYDFTASIKKPFQMEELADLLKKCVKE